MDSWLNPELSLQTEARQELDRRAAVKLDHQDLQQLTDTLIVQWYRQQQIIGCAMKRVMQLELEVMLAEAEPMDRSPSPEHYRMARELLADQGRCES